MDSRTISMGGAAWHASSIAEAGSKSDFVKRELKGWAYIDKTTLTRETLLSQVWDLAKKQYPELFPLKNQNEFDVEKAVKVIRGMKEVYNKK